MFTYKVLHTNSKKFLKGYIFTISKKLKLGSNNEICDKNGNLIILEEINKNG